MTNKSAWRWRYLSALVMIATTTVLAQSGTNFDEQISQGTALLQAGQPNGALAAGRTAIGLSPERWDGYALTGRALLALRRYEAAADALSEAIERAPAGQESALRQLRRDALLAESGYPAPAGAPAAAPSVPPPAPPQAQAIPPNPPAVPVSPPPPPPVAAAAVPAAPSTAASAPPPAPPSLPAVAAAATAPVGAVTQTEPAAAGLDQAVWLDGPGRIMWARPWYYPPGASGPWSYQDAAEFCSRLRLAGYADWRLPTLEELQGVYLASSKGWRWSKPKFDPGYGIDYALDRQLWRVADFEIAGDRFNGNRLLIWSSTPGGHPDEHAAVYFGRRYSVKDDSRVGISLQGSARNPFHAYAFCVRTAR